jgi:hypothetical protein
LHNSNELAPQEKVQQLRGIMPIKAQITVLNFGSKTSIQPPLHVPSEGQVLKTRTKASSTKFLWPAHQRNFLTGKTKDNHHSGKRPEQKSSQGVLNHCHGWDQCWSYGDSGDQLERIWQKEVV